MKKSVQNGIVKNKKQIILEQNKGLKHSLSILHHIYSITGSCPLNGLWMQCYFQYQKKLSMANKWKIDVWCLNLLVMKADMWKFQSEIVGK